MHQRLSPKRYALRHSLFMFYLDLDEIGPLAADACACSAAIAPTSTAFAMPITCRVAQRRWLRRCAQTAGCRPTLAAQGIALPPQARIRLLTLPRIAGYVFNPISVYFCFAAAEGAPICAVAEVGNTFGEHKLYLLPCAAAGG